MATLTASAVTAFSLLHAQVSYDMNLSFVTETVADDVGHSVEFMPPPQKEAMREFFRSFEPTAAEGVA